MVTKKKTAKKVTKKKSKRKVAGRKAVKRKLPGWIILLTGILFGLIIAVFGYIKGWVPKPDNPNKPVAEVISNSNNDKIEDKIDELKIKPKKDFDFYRNLKEMQVEIDESQQTDNRKPPKPKSLLIQIGSFKNQTDAESIKAKVAFSGFSATIKPVNVNGSTWFRVIIGPYTSSREADKDKRKLQNNDFKPIIIKQ